MIEYGEQILLAAKLLKLTTAEVQEYSGIIQSSGALYISVPLKGGDSLIVGKDGTVLYANSSVDYDIHVNEFEKGRRTPMEEFE